MTIFQLDSGERRWYIVGYYIAPDDVATIERVIAAIGQCPHGEVLLVDGNFNVNLAAPEGRRRRKEITSDILTVGLEELYVYFLLGQTSWARDCRTWCMKLCGREVRSWTD